MNIMTSTIYGLLRNPECPISVIRDALQEQGVSVAKISIIVGSTGEYSDYNTWLVAAYLLKEHADVAAEKLNAWCMEHGFHNGIADYSERRSLKPPGDPQFSCDYNGTKYTVEEVDLRCE